MEAQAVSSHFPSGSDSKVSAYNVGDLGLIPGSEDPLEKEMAAHSSTVAWKIPWMEEPGRLQSMGSQRVDTTEPLHFASLQPISENELLNGKQGDGPEKSKRTCLSFCRHVPIFW